MTPKGYWDFSAPSPPVPFYSPPNIPLLTQPPLPPRAPDPRGRRILGWGLGLGAGDWGLGLGAGAGALGLASRPSKGAGTK